MKNDLTQLQHILAVARERRFGRAADQLGIGQPALSRSIKKFEDKHKVRVFDRGRGGVVPTAAGVQIIREAEKILRSLRDLQHHIRLYGEQGAGLIRVVVTPMLSSLILPRLSLIVLRKEQQALLDAIVPASEQWPAMLLDERTEITFCSRRMALNRPGLVVEHIGLLETGAFVRAGHPLCARDHLTVDDIVEYPILCVSDLTDSRTDSKVRWYHLLRYRHS